MSSQSRGVGIPLKARGRDRVPRVLVGHSQLGVPEAKVMEALTHSVRRVGRDIQGFAIRRQAYAFIVDNRDTRLPIVQSSMVGEHGRSSQWLVALVLLARELAEVLVEA